MSKRYKMKTCVYCAAKGTSQTGDHVFAREFFRPNQRSGLPKVPACNSCNHAKSELEHYLTAVLPFGNRLSDSVETLNQMVPPRLSSNQKLRRHLAEKATRAWSNEGGILLPTTAIPFDSEKLSMFFRYVVRGMAAYHWDVIVPAHYFVGAGMLSSVGESVIARFLAMRSKARVVQSLADGVVRYEGSQAFDDAGLSFWSFSMYGGVVFGGDPVAAEEAPTRIWAMTAPYPLPGLFDGQ